MRGTRVVIHLSTPSYDAMYREREGKSKLEQSLELLLRILFSSAEVVFFSS